MQDTMECCNNNQVVSWEGCNQVLDIARVRSSCFCRGIRAYLIVNFHLSPVDVQHWTQPYAKVHEPLALVGDSTAGLFSLIIACQSALMRQLMAMAWT